VGGRLAAALGLVLLVTGGGAGCGPCLGEFSECSPRGGPRGLEAVYSLANQAPAGSRVYWLGEGYATSDRVTTLSTGGEGPGGPPGKYADILQATKIRGEGVNVLVITRLPRPTRPAPPKLYERGEERLLFSVTFPDGGRADVYVWYDSAPRYDDELRRKLRPDVQPVPIKPPTAPPP
jgi:hypothetical protein